MFPMPGTKVHRRVKPSGGVVSVQFFSSNATITIPATATKAYVKMWGGSGGGGGAAGGTVVGASGGGGAAGYLEKYLTGLFPGLTLSFTAGSAGAAGSATPGNGGNGTASTLASGTQSITTLTANGGTGSNLATGGTPSQSAGGVGGTATNGDLNLTGQPGSAGIVDFNNPTAVGYAGIGGFSLYGTGGRGAVAPGVGVAGNAGVSGGLIIEWYI